MSDDTTIRCRPMLWMHFCEWVSGKTVKSEESVDWDNSAWRVRFTDGTSAVFRSQSYAFDSDSGMEPPTVEVFERVTE